jgi:hypothetical protein
MRRWGVSAALVMAALLSSARVSAYSLLPLVTQEAEPLPSGIAEATLGIEYLHNGTFPLFTPPGTLESQDVVNAPQFAFNIGAGGWVEIQMAYQIVYESERNSDGSGNANLGSGDATIFTKVRLLHEKEWLPALGLRFGTKLPNGNHALHLGTDATDWAGEILATKNFGVVSLDTNLGIGLLGVPAPTQSGGQDDVVLYGVALVSRPLGGGDDPEATHVRLMAEVAGITASHYDNDRSSFRAGVQVVHGRGTFYLGLSTGLVSGSEQFGASGGFTYTFDVTQLFAE